ncbi:DcrB-related protein [Deinococcus kurensis]|uniref:DcrB-related protein n=1 Tax=Deinococcus kurensis TaxID=2662757 RepID=UPI0013911A93|nr:DcrB-related protein [Deinococcus kurensis]
MKLALRRPLTPLMVALLALNAGGLAAAYKDAVNGFAVTPPPGWKQSTYPGTAVVFLTAPVDGFATNINVVVQPLPAGMTQAAYHTLSLKQIRTLVTDAHILSTRAVTLGGVPGNSVVYTGRQGQFKLYFFSTYAVRGGRAFLVTTTTRQGSEAGAKSVNDAVVKSFQILR